MMNEEEVTRGGGVAPGMADDAAAEKGLGGQENEDLPDDDLIREDAAGRWRSCSCSLRHVLGGRSGARGVVDVCFSSFTEITRMPGYHRLVFFQNLGIIDLRTWVSSTKVCTRHVQLPIRERRICHFIVFYFCNSTYLAVIMSLRI